MIQLDGKKLTDLPLEDERFVRSDESQLAEEKRSLDVHMEEGRMRDGREETHAVWVVLESCNQSHENGVRDCGRRVWRLTPQNGGDGRNVDAVEKTHLGQQSDRQRGVAIAVVDLQVGRRIGSVGGIAHNEKEQLSEGLEGKRGGRFGKNTLDDVRKDPVFPIQLLEEDDKMVAVDGSREFQREERVDDDLKCLVENVGTNRVFAYFCYQICHDRPHPRVCVHLCIGFCRGK